MEEALQVCPLEILLMQVELMIYIDRSAPSSMQSHRVPYFRYFGPTAIVPGFKQMVVSVREHRRSTGAASIVAGKHFSRFHFQN